MNTLMHTENRLGTSVSPEEAKKLIERYEKMKYEYSEGSLEYMALDDKIKDLCEVINAPASVVDNSFSVQSNELVAKVMPFGKEEAYVVVPKKWVDKKVKITLM